MKTMYVTYALGTSVLFALSLHLWRVWYPVTDWALISLLPLGVLVFAGSHETRAALHRANMRASIREGSPLVLLMKGRLRAVSTATLFTVVAVSMLAWKALSFTYPELLLLTLQWTCHGLMPLLFLT